LQQSWNKTLKYLLSALTLALLITIKDPSRLNSDVLEGYIATNTAVTGFHEYLNDKHIKDFESFRRTVVTVDGSMMTMAGSGPATRMLPVSIYDGAQSYQIDCLTMKLSLSSGESATTAARDPLLNAT
jgi:hypothetical protein